MVVPITVYSIFVFTKQPSAERYLANLCFTSNSVNFQKILAAHQKKTFRKFSESSQKIHPRGSLILAKLQALFHPESSFRSQDI